MRWISALLMGVSVLLSTAQAQEYALLPEPIVTWITQEISGDAAYETIRHLTQFHRPTGGADGLIAAARYVERKAREYGLQDVRLIYQPARRKPWNARLGEIWMISPRVERIASTLQTPLHLADFSHPVDAEARLVDVGAGTKDADYADRDVRNAVVLAHGPLSRVIRKAVWERDALGVVWFPNPQSVRNLTHPHQIRWARVPLDVPQGKRKPFAFILSLAQGLQLRRFLAETPQPVWVHVRVDAAFTSKVGDQPWQVMVEAFIRGTDPQRHQDIVLVAHLQEEKFSANDNASGCASILEIARALNRLIHEGRIPRPIRNLRFWWTTEISSERQYFADHPEASRSMWVAINQDMVGANQAQGPMRVQNITRLPASRFHFFNDVVEAVIEYMVTINNAELAQWQAGISTLYPRPVIAHLGTQHRYNAKMIFFHNNTDHMTFNEAPIGVPAITFTNWPDPFIHTSDDDLWNIDRTQLQRNAAAAALIAYTMAMADEAMLPKLAAETVGRGQQRLDRNLHLALRWLTDLPDKEQAYKMAMDQITYAVHRERQALASLMTVTSQAQALVQLLQRQLQTREHVMRTEVQRFYQALTGRHPPHLHPTETEKALAQLRPRIVGTPQDFLERRRRIQQVQGLHRLMAFEILNFIDGRRTGLDIYRMVAGEAREAGAYYYGTVTPEKVLTYLKNAAQQDLIALR